MSSRTPADRELDVAVGELPDLGSLWQGPAWFRPDRRVAGSIGRECDVERQVDRKVGEELAQLADVERLVAVGVGAGEGVCVDRKLVLRKLVVGPSRAGRLLPLSYFLSKSRAGRSDDSPADQLDHRRKRHEARLAAGRFAPKTMVVAVGVERLDLVGADHFIIVEVERPERSGDADSSGRVSWPSLSRSS